MTSMFKQAGAAILVLSALSSHDGAIAANIASEERHKAVDRIFAEWDNLYSPGCAVGVSLKGRSDYVAGYGMANLEHDLPITPDTVFYIASTSKQFTAMATLLAARAGYFSLEDDIRDFFPELPDYGETVTVDDLVHHTSGLADYLLIWLVSGRSMDSYMPLEQAIDLVSRQPALKFEPGSRFSYSNTGYLLLGALIERTTNKSLRQFSEEHIFSRLNMADTHFHDDHKMIVKNRADGHSKNENGGYDLSRSAFDLVGSGGLHTTVRDMLKWNQNFSEKKLEKGSSDLMRRYLDRGIDTGEAGGGKFWYGFGLGSTSYRGLRIVRHSGGSFGYRAQYLRIPEKRFAAVALCNASNIEPNELLERVVDAYLFGGIAEASNNDEFDEYEDEDHGANEDVTGPATGHSQIVNGEDRIVGEYYSYELDSLFRIRRTNDGLELQRGYAQPSVMAPLKNNYYAVEIAPGFEMQVTFSPGADNDRQQDRLKIRTEPLGLLELNRKK